MKKIIRILWALFFYVLLFPVSILMIVIGPLMSFTDMLDVYKLGAPRLDLGLSIIAIVGFILFLSMKYSSLNWIYRKFPVLLPFFQMCFLSFIIMQISLMFANLWADDMLIGKTVAMGLTILTIVIGRVFLSYWYYKYPISYKMMR
ncbi:hypothetical protein [Exiguobacterium flavidum]|uniref:hypothetical protein n=1 Tax=Exiguobacterium flavidum TaxID=2184695 RepID=UPI000DF813A3|nr:hypothetical protein [Exiguobacterium flavidum]